MGALNSLISNHVVQGRVIFPGAGYLEMARAITATQLRSVFFLQPLAMDAPMLVVCAVSDGRFDVCSCEADAIEATTVHCSGTTVGANAWQHIDYTSLCYERSSPAEVAALYSEYYAVGLHYGPGYRTLMQAWGGASNALARLRSRSTHEGTRVHPADLDDALCLGGLIISSGGDGETSLPFAVDDVLLQSASGELWAVRGS